MGRNATEGKLMISKILNFEYVFKVGTEIAWAGLVAGVAVAAQIIAGTDLATVLADPGTYVVALLVAAGRAAGVAALNALRAAIAAVLA